MKVNPTKRKSLLIGLLIILIVVIVVWQFSKKSILKEVITESVSKSTEGFYKVDYDSSQIDELGGMPEDKAYRDLENLLLSQLLAKGQFAVGRDYYLKLPNAKPRVLTSLGFDVDNMSARSGPLGWQLVQGASAGSDWSGDTGNQALATFANSGERGIVASKSLFLAPGNYRIDITFGASSMPPASAIEWSMNCLSEAQPVSVWRSGPLRPVAGIKAYGRANVTPSCRFQTIEIAMAGGESQNGAELVVESAQVSRQR